MSPSERTDLLNLQYKSLVRIDAVRTLLAPQADGTHAMLNLLEADGTHAMLNLLEADTKECIKLTLKGCDNTKYLPSTKLGAFIVKLRNVFEPGEPLHGKDTHATTTELNLYNRSWRLLIAALNAGDPAAMLILRDELKVKRDKNVFINTNATQAATKQAKPVSTKLLHDEAFIASLYAAFEPGAPLHEVGKPATSAQMNAFNRNWHLFVTALNKRDNADALALLSRLNVTRYRDGHYKFFVRNEDQ